MFLFARFAIFAVKDFFQQRDAFMFDRVLLITLK
jgi:hypothetical protein